MKPLDVSNVSLQLDKNTAIPGTTPGQITFQPGFGPTSHHNLLEEIYGHYIDTVLIPQLAKESAFFAHVFNQDRYLKHSLI